MQSYLFMGGDQDGFDIQVAPDQDTVELTAGITSKERYVRSTLAVDDVSITIYHHQSLTSAQVLNLFVKHYQAWCVNRPGGRR